MTPKLLCLLAVTFVVKWNAPGFDYLSCDKARMPCLTGHPQESEFKTLAEADKIAKELKALGVEATITKVTISEQKVYTLGSSVYPYADAVQKAAEDTDLTLGKPFRFADAAEEALAETEREFCRQNLKRCQDDFMAYREITGPLRGSK